MRERIAEAYIHRARLRTRRLRGDAGGHQNAFRPPLPSICRLRHTPCRVQTLHSVGAPQRKHSRQGNRVHQQKRRIRNNRSRRMCALEHLASASRPKVPRTGRYGAWTGDNRAETRRSEKAPAVVFHANLNSMQTLRIRQREPSEETLPPALRHDDARLQKQTLVSAFFPPRHSRRGLKRA